MRLIVIASLVLSLGVFGFVACSSSTPAGAPPTSDAGTPDSGDASTTPAIDSSLPASDAAEDGGMEASATPDALAGPFVAVSSIPLAGSPSAMAFNPVMNSLYVALTGIGSPATGTGIAVIDSATNTVAVTIPYPGDASAPFPIVQMAVDYLSNTLYAADSNFPSGDGGGGQTLYVIDGVTNAVVTTIPVVSDLGMQVDSSAHKVYILGAGVPSVPDGGTSAVSPPTITILDGTTNDAGAPIVVGDQAIFSGSAIAFDPIVRQLYLCGPNATQYSTATMNLAAIDTLDTANGLAPVGAQESYAGERAIACLAGWGGGAVVTTSAAAVDFVGGATIALPSFAATAALGSAGALPAKADVVVFGSAAPANGLEVIAVTENQDAGTSVAIPPTIVLGDAGASGWQAVTLASASGGVIQAYLTLTTSGDGGAGTPVPSVTYATIQVQ